MSPRALVAMPVYNAEATLDEALDSVLAQTGVEFDCLAVDDGSTDPSLEILRRRSDPRLLVHPLTHRGLCGALNHAVEYAAANGYEYLIRMDSDDLSQPGRFQRLVQYMDEHPRCAAVSSNCEYFTADGRGSGTSTISVRQRQIAFEIRHGLRGLIHGACCFRVRALVEVGGYREQFRGAEDTDLFVRLEERFELGNVPEFLYQIRVDLRSKSRSNIQRNFLYARYALDCSRQRRRGLPERSYEEFLASVDGRALPVKLEIWSMALWERSHKGGWRKALVPLAAVLSPIRVYARIVRTIAG